MSPAEKEALLLEFAEMAIENQDKINEILSQPAKKGGVLGKIRLKAIQDKALPLT